jgi:hypothetical protein
MFDEDDSSLTEPSTSSDDEAYKPSASAKKPTRKKGDYTLKGVLKAPRTSTYSAKALYGMWHVLGS